MDYRVNCTVIWDIKDVNCTLQEVFEKAKLELKDKIYTKEAKTIFNIDCLKEKEETKIKLCQINLEDFFPYVGFQAEKKEYIVNGVSYFVKMNSSRYILFHNNPKCVSCGLVGEYLFLEKNINDKSAHINFYAKEDDNFVLMTKDHIKAKSIGGANRLSNYQTMCQICNNLKSDYNVKTEDVNKLKKIYLENKNNLTQKQLSELITIERDKFHTPWINNKNLYYLKENIKLKENNGILTAVVDDCGEILKGETLLVDCTTKDNYLVSYNKTVFLIEKNLLSKIE